MVAQPKYNFKIRFNTEWAKTPNLCWRVLINDVEHLVSDVIISGIVVRTTAHILATGERKWSIYCEADEFTIDEDNRLIIEKPAEQGQGTGIHVTSSTG